MLTLLTNYAVIIVENCSSAISLRKIMYNIQFPVMLGLYVFLHYVYRYFC
jgi:hypothetical protein